MSPPNSTKSMRTPLGRVRNLGSSHSGTTDFWRQRLTAVAMTLLLLPMPMAKRPGAASANEATLCAKQAGDRV